MSSLSIEQRGSGIVDRWGIRFREITEDEIGRYLPDAVDDALVAAEYGGAAIDREAATMTIASAIDAHNDVERVYKGRLRDVAQLAGDELKNNPAIRSSARLVGLSVDEYLEKARKEAGVRVRAAVELVRTTFDDVPSQFHAHHNHDEYVA